MYHLAQVNIGRMLAPLDDPIMAGFVAKLDAVNALADSSRGFVWRFQTSDGNATSVRPYEDPFTIFNMSVWESIEDLSYFVYAMGSEHRPVMKQRRQWFARFDGPFQTLWWVPSGHIPTVEEAKERLEHLRSQGETPYAFSFKTPFPAPGAEKDTVPQKFSEECPA